MNCRRLRRGFSEATLRTRRAAGLNSSSLLDEIEASDSTCVVSAWVFGVALADANDVGTLVKCEDGSLLSAQVDRGTNCDAPSTLLEVLPLLKAVFAFWVVNLPGESSCLPAVVLVLLNINRRLKKQGACRL